MANIFTKLENHWDSDAAYLEEYSECTVEHLNLLLSVGMDCLCAIENNHNKDYWQWRAENNMFVPAKKMPLPELQTHVERTNRLLLKAINLKSQKSKIK